MTDAAFKQLIHRSKYEVHLKEELQKSQSYLCSALGRMPTVEELAAYTNRSCAVVRAHLKPRDVDCICSLDAPLFEEEDDEGWRLALAAPSDTYQPEVIVETKDQEMWVQRCLTELSESQRAVLLHRYCDNRIRTKREVAEMMGLTETRIAQIEAAALQILHRLMGAGPR